MNITCDCKTVKPIADLEPFQGNIKSMNAKDRAKLVNLLETYGIRFPFYVWGNKILNGHQRYDVLLNDFNYTGDVPVVEVEAEDENEAKELVLVATSQHGRFNIEDLQEFTKGLSDIDSMALVDGPSIDLDFKVDVKPNEPVTKLEDNIEIIDQENYEPAEVEEIKTNTGDSITFPDGTVLTAGDDRYFFEEVIRMWNSRNKSQRIELPNLKR